MKFGFDDRTKALAEAGAALGARCRGQTPAQVGEDWRAAGAVELMSVSVTDAAVFLDAYAAARGTLRAARVHAEVAMARAPWVLEAVLLAAGVEGLVTEVVENLRLPEETRPRDFPHERDPDSRRALADARTGSVLARNAALRAAWVVDAGAPAADVANAPALALSCATEAVLKSWPGLSRLVLVEEAYLRMEADLFRVAARLKPLALAAVATALVGELPPSRSETTVTAERN